MISLYRLYIEWKTRYILYFKRSRAKQICFNSIQTFVQAEFALQRLQPDILNPLEGFVGGCSSVCNLGQQHHSQGQKRLTFDLGAALKPLKTDSRK